MTRDDTRYLVFATDTPPRTQRSLPPAYTLALWTPSLRRIMPPGPASPHLAIWWLAHHGRLFRNRDYRVLTIRYGMDVVHRSIAFPPYFAFPFMARGDVQIGGVWTDPAHRGRGLATIAVGRILHALHAPARRIWYITASDNLASVSTARSTGMRHVALARRTVPAGVRALGRYELTDVAASSASPSAPSLTAR